MKIMFVTNILTPYRLSFYDSLYEQISLRNWNLQVIAMTDELPLRPWNYSELKREYTRLLQGKKLFLGEMDILFNYGVKRAIRSYNPDVIVLAGSWTYPTVLYITEFRNRVLPKDCKLFFWYESHDNASEEFKAKSLNNWLVTKTKNRFLKKFDGFCVPGDLARMSVSKFVKEARFVYLRNAVDGDFYSKANELRKNKITLREKYGIDVKAIAIIMPARLIRLKGIHELLSRIDQNIIKAFDFEFVFAGEGDQQQVIETIAKEKGIKTIFLGYQQQDNVRELLAACDYFCLSSLTDANPLSAIEAAWAGLPLLMSKYTGNYPELIDKKVNGMVFDPLSKESINGMFKWMMQNNEQWWDNASQVSVEIAKEKFDVKCIVNSLLDQIKGL